MEVFYLSNRNPVLWHPDKQKWAKRNYLLKNISIELLLSVTKELANHLPTQAFTLKKEFSNSQWSVRHNVLFYQILDPFFWFPRDTGKGKKQQETNKEKREHNPNM